MRHWHHNRDDLDERELLLAILYLLEDLAAALLPAPNTEPATATLTFQGDTMSDITVPDTTPTQTATVAFLDADGEPTTPQSVPAWSSSDDSVASVDASADPTGLTATITLTGSLGTATITAATTNTDGTIVTASGTITVAASEPASGDITFA